MVTVPLLLSQISSKRYKRSFGTLHQIAIGIGMIVAQSLSIPFAKPFAWRYVLAVGFTIPALLLALSGTIVLTSATQAGASTESDEAGDEETPLVNTQKKEGKELSVWELWSAESTVRRGCEFIPRRIDSTLMVVLVVVASQFAQQICGISPGTSCFVFSAAQLQLRVLQMDDRGCRSY